MPLEDPVLYSQIQGYEFPFRLEMDEGLDPPRQCTSFVHNVRKAGDWTETSAAVLVNEYRRFLYLKAITEDALTPPQWIDEVWHLHLSMDADLATFCSAIGRVITHQTGLSQTQSLAGYKKTLSAYRQQFDRQPLREIWPEVDAVRRAPIWKAVSGVMKVSTLGCFVLYAMTRQGVFFAAFLLQFVWLLPVLLVFTGGPQSPPKIARCE